MANENGQEKRETLAEIVAEMRNEVGDGMDTYAGLRIVRHMEDARVRNYCDRIEAALKRWREAVEANALAVGGIVEAARHTPGNAAAMREALEMILDKVNGLDEECGVDPVEIRDLARAALSAPARNCDALSADDVKSRFKERMASSDMGLIGENIVEVVSGVVDFLYATEKGAEEGGAE